MDRPTKIHKIKIPNYYNTSTSEHTELCLLTVAHVSFKTINTPYAAYSIDTGTFIINAVGTV